MDAWDWVAKEIKENGNDGDWLRAGSSGDIKDVSARAFSMMGNCRFPLYVTPDMGREWFDTWKMINVRRM